jgi:hypothetical protein
MPAFGKGRKISQCCHASASYVPALMNDFGGEILTSEIFFYV